MGRDSFRSRTDRAISAGFHRATQEGLLKRATYTRMNRAITRAIAKSQTRKVQPVDVYPALDRYHNGPSSWNRRWAGREDTYFRDAPPRTEARVIKGIIRVLLKIDLIEDEVALRVSEERHGREFAYMFINFIHGLHGAAAAKIFKEEFKAEGLKYSWPRQLSDSQRAEVHARLINGQMKNFTERVKRDLQALEDEGF